MTTLLKTAVAAILALSVYAQPARGEAAARPNVVLIMTDDQGYADVGCYGAKGFQTPHLDRMAVEGIRFTNFYVSQAICGASRASLLTGCYANRISLLSAPSPNSRTGIHDNEETLAEVLKERDYATAIYGKWHLGDHKKFLPLQHGFDDYYGLPYSNDMWPFHPTAGDQFPKLPLIERNEIIQYNPDQSKLTTSYTERAVAFIAKNKHRPFFLYVAHTMPHVPLFVSSKFAGKSEQGLFGDVIEEIDWSVGQILQVLRDADIDKQTLVIFTSDNGPSLSYGNHAGSAGPLREGKGTAWEGGVRVPCIMRWPGKIKAGSVCHELAATIDILPTVAKLADAPLPKRKIDGRDIWPLMSGDPTAKTPHEAYFYYYGRGLHAVRSGKWKLHFPHPYRTLPGAPGKDGNPAVYTQKQCGLELYDLENDIGETTDVSQDHPDVVKRLQALGELMRAELGDSLRKREGKAVRPAGRI